VTHDPAHPAPPLARRDALRIGAAALGALLVGRPAAARPGPAIRRLDLYAVNTGERLRAEYVVDGRYQPGALDAVSHLLRDHRSGEVHPIDPSLLDVVHRLAERLGATRPIHVVCGYRSPETNRRKLAAGERVAQNSFHLHGRAVDLVVPGRPSTLVRRAALSLRLGGVGHYPGAGFVHVDTGPVRTW
jgi:uncharacterized protein YcbK (DUF882 family)